MERRATASAAVFVRRPPEQVFAYVADVSRHGQWSPKKLSMADLPADGVLVAGSTFTSYGHLPGEDAHRNDVRVLTLDHPRVLVLESTDLSGTYRNTFDVTEQGEGSVVTRQLDLPRPDGALGLMVPLFVRLVLGRDLAKGLRRLASQLHSQGEG